MNRSNKNFLIAFVALIVVLTIIGNTFYSSKEYKEEIRFYIAKINTSPAYRLTFYDRTGKKHSWNQFVFMANDKIAIGDSIYKKAKSSYLYVYRQNASGVWNIVCKKKQAWF